MEWAISRGSRQRERAAAEHRALIRDVTRLFYRTHGHGAAWVALRRHLDIVAPLSSEDWHRITLTDRLVRRPVRDDVEEA
jgi:hypothetical protein